MKIKIIGKEKNINKESKFFLDMVGAEIKYYYVDGSGGDINKFFEYQKKHFQESFRLLTPGEMGCALSHINAYRDIVKENEYSIVFEDDFIVKGILDLSVIYDLMNDVIKDDLLILGVQDGLPSEKYLKDGHLYIVPPKYKIWRTAAYCIGPVLAKNLADIQEISINRADDWVKFQDKLRFNVYYINLFSHPLIPGLMMENQRKMSEVSFKKFAISKILAIFKGHTFKKPKRLKVVKFPDKLVLTNKTKISL